MPEIGAREEDRDVLAKQAMSSGAKTKDHLLGLDGLRGVAAIAVAIHHTQKWTNQTLFGHAYLATDFFMVLSGFVLSFAYRDRLRSGMSLRAFMSARIYRLYPMIIFSAFLSLCLIMIDRVAGNTDKLGGYLALSFVSGLLCLPIHIPGVLDPFPINGPEWSLFYEFALSLCFVLFIARLNARAIAGMTCLIIMPYIYVCHQRGLNYGFRYYDFGLAALRLLVPFMLGVITYDLWKSGRCLGIKLPISILAPALVAIFFTPRLPRADWLVASLTTLLIFPFIVLSGSRQSLSRIATKVSRTSSSISYPLYLVHVPIYSFGFFYLQRIGFSGLFATLAMVLSCVGIAWLLDRHVDQPLIRMFKRRRLHTELKLNIGPTPPLR